MAVGRQRRATRPSQWAEAVLRPLANAGEDPAAGRLAALLVEQGRFDEAIIMVRQRADDGDDDAAMQQRQTMVIGGVH